MSFYLVLFKILDKKETLCQMMLVKRNSRMIGERLRKSVQHQGIRRNFRNLTRNINTCFGVDYYLLGVSQIFYKFQRIFEDAAFVSFSIFLFYD